MSERDDDVKAPGAIIREAIVEITGEDLGLFTTHQAVRLLEKLRPHLKDSEVAS